MQTERPCLLGVQRTLWGLTGRHGTLFFLRFMKPDVEPPKCFPQTQLFKGEAVAAHPVQAPRGRKWFSHTSALLADSLLIENPAKWAPVQPWSAPGRHTLSSLFDISLFYFPSYTLFLSRALPAGLWKGCFALFLLQPGVLACFLSRNLKSWLPGSALPACFHLLSLFRVSRGLLATHLGSISCPSFCGRQPGDSPGGAFWSVNDTTAEKQGGWNYIFIYFQLEYSQLNKPTSKKIKTKQQNNPHTAKAVGEK